VVWERNFATEDEADEAYEQFLDHVDHPQLEVDRYDGNTVRVYLDTHALESRAQMIEAAMEPHTITTACSCGHMAAAHKGEDSLCSVDDCECIGFERAAA
jgi:hypothetical protein